MMCNLLQRELFSFHDMMTFCRDGLFCFTVWQLVAERAVFVSWCDYMLQRGLFFFHLSFHDVTMCSREGCFCFFGYFMM